MTIAYDGTDYYGWQIQPHEITVVQRLQDTFFSLLGIRITIIGASRTDAGVHALGQVARFAAELPDGIDLDRIRHGWNARLQGIIIRSLSEAPKDFHPCANVRQKTYWYILFKKPPLPFISRFGWYYRFMPYVDIKKFEACLQLYVGTHDFGSFCKAEDGKTTIRRIDSIRLKNVHRWGAYLIEIKGPSFVRFQIRRMIGYALDVARQQDLSVDYLKSMLTNPNPLQKLLKADGRGLILRRIIYHHERGL